MKLSFELADGGSPRTLDFEARRLVIAGWTGRDAAAIAHHIEELAALGVPAPSAVPLFYRVAINQLSQGDVVQVVGEDTSGEVEPLLFLHGGEWYVSIGSDHTDRALEAHSVALSKQICAKPVARSAWRLADVQDRWDALVLRSWIEEGGEWRLYQEGTLAALRPPADLLARCAAAGGEPAEGFAMTCGTVGAIGGIRPSARFRMELADEHTGRRIAHEYRTAVLPVVA
ncbi:DUF2848 domain-containing protein [Ottowia sp.]|uniref:DUF2848 domain-containing protein n=1 Tax=Ottowia sp. TaxID=1898956 RepID=UPI0025E19BF7|nr:DUF2848 domain-containing protein [Ottowia sp.]MBK6613249.1 DUF2848 domain-containing protein [Ottowia sp.]MBK6747643.1 DUF2848 domain-containing protein [Ottowia sp.]